MTVYHINCASPSSHLDKAKTGDKVHVVGKVRNSDVRAVSIEDLTAKSGECECSSQLPSAKAEGIEIFPKDFDKTGTISNVKWGDGWLKFDLEVK
jgi:hypothetical protein